MGGNSEDWAYIAGLLDGEGSVSFTHRKGVGRNNLRIYKLVNITNSHRDTIEWLRSFTGYGSVSSTIPHKDGVTYRIVYHYKIANSKDILDFLGNVQPYVRIKARQVELAIDVLVSRTEALANDYHAPLSDYEYFLIEEIQHEKNSLVTAGRGRYYG